MMKTKILSLLVVAYMMQLNAASEGMSVAAQANSAYFAETGHRISGKFLVYWESHGQLMQLGQPISDQLTEVSELNGQSYTVQYFERAELESHPENQPPYDMLLSQLGSLRYREKYASNAPLQVPSTDSPYLFPTTGKVVGGIFRRYWEQHGGLAQFGYPISNELTEQSELNKQSYIVQYFERAEFEYHPENQLPYTVLLSQLGKFRYDAKSNKAKPPMPADTSSPILLTNKLVGNVVTSGTKLFWSDAADAGSAIYGYDVEKSTRFLVAQRPLPSYVLAADEKTLIWGEISSPNIRIQTYDIVTQKELASFDYGSSSNFEGFHGFAVAGDVVYYQGQAPEHLGLYARNLKTNQERLISSNGRNPVASDGILLWNEQRYRGQDLPPELTLHMMVIKDTKGDAVIAKLDSGGGFSGYSIAGHYIVWSPEPLAPNRGVQLYDVNTEISKTIFDGPATYPIIGGNRVIWIDAPFLGYSGFPIVAYNITDATSSVISKETSARTVTRVVAGGNVLAYTAYGNSLDELYIVYLK